MTTRRFEIANARRNLWEISRLARGGVVASELIAELTAVLVVYWPVSAELRGGLS